MRAKYFNYRRPPRPADNSWHWFLAKPNELTGILTVAVTLILALATVMLWLATRTLVIDAEDTAKRQLRAYLYITPNDFKLMNSPDGSTTVTVKPSLKVFGLTPVTSIVPVWYVMLQEVPSSIAMPSPNLIPESWLATAHDVSNLVENPTQDMPIPGKSITLQKDDIEALKQGHKLLNAYGTISYEDVFGIARWTNFCWVSDWNDIITNNFHLCLIYNDTDWGRPAKNNIMTLPIAPITIK
jgi:hypothetical protein